MQVVGDRQSPWRGRHPQRARSRAPASGIAELHHVTACGRRATRLVRPRPTCPVRPRRTRPPDAASRSVLPRPVQPRDARKLGLRPRVGVGVDGQLVGVVHDRAGKPQGGTPGSCTRRRARGWLPPTGHCRRWNGSRTGCFQAPRGAARRSGVLVGDQVNRAAPRSRRSDLVAPHGRRARGIPAGQSARAQTRWTPFAPVTSTGPSTGWLIRGATGVRNGPCPRYGSRPAANRCPRWGRPARVRAWLGVKVPCRR